MKILKVKIRLPPAWNNHGAWGGGGGGETRQGIPRKKKAIATKKPCG